MATSTRPGPLPSSPPVTTAEPEPSARATPGSRAGRLRRLGRLPLAALAVLGAVLTGLRAVPRLQELPGAGLVASFAAYGLIVWGVVAVLAVVVVRGRARATATVAALALAGVHAGWIVPYYIADHQAPGGTPLTILSVNVLGGAADPDALTRAAEGADVVVLLEYDATMDAALADRGWAHLFPHRVGDPADWAIGSVIYSRRPLREIEQLGTRFGTYLVEVDPGRPDAVGLLAGHPVNPPIGRIAWVREARMMGDAARSYAGPRLVVIGDLNSTPDHVTIRRMRAEAGLRDAAQEAGAGWLRTYPANRALIPPLLGLDQALLRGRISAESVETVRVPGTDHLGIRVGLVVR